MTLSKDVRSNRTAVGRAMFPAAAVSLLAAGIALAACSKAPAAGTPSAETASPPVGGMQDPTPESFPTVEAMGVYPLPGSVAGGGTPAPKNELRSKPTSFVYLPAVINEKPPLYPFEVQQTGVLAVQGFFGCEWTAVAGQVFDATGDPVPNLIVHLEGFWNGGPVSAEALSGSATQYGPAGYEFILGNRPLNSTQALWIHLLDGTRKQISGRVYFNTYNDCTKNLILINFVMVYR